ncbi:hypothetical protein ACFL4T_02315 [candidate division KSB1 bacterium]
MDRFSSYLEELRNNPDIPENLRGNIINEISGDMNDIFDLFINRGLSEKEAEKKVLEKYSLSDDLINEFVSIYRSPVKKIVRGIADQVKSLWGKLLLFVIISLILFSTGIELLNTEFYLNASIFIWPVLFIACFVFLISGIEFNNIFIKKNPDVERSKARLANIVLLGGLSFLTGIAGFCIELLFASKRGMIFDPVLSFLMAYTGPDSGSFMFNIDETIIKCAGLMMLSLFILIFYSFIWLIMNNQLAKIEYLIKHFDKNEHV